MKKSSFFTAISWTILLSWQYARATTVNPTPGDTTWTLASRLGQVSDETTPIPVFNADQSGGTITLSSTGNYRVAENLIYPIVISTDEICLDLNCKKISSSNGSTNLITVNNDLKDISIHNGLLVNTDTPTGTGAGILIQNGASSIDLESVRASGCGNGVKLDGQNGNEVIACNLVALDLVSNTTGLVLNHADENVIKDCCAFSNTQAGFEMLNSEANCFYDCQALETFGPKTTMGFTSRAGQSNLFQGCVSERTKTSAWEFYTKACGFLLTGTEEKTEIIDCTVNETEVTSTVSAIAYGIQLDPTLQEGSDLLSTVDSIPASINAPQDIAWSPDGKYIAAGEGSAVSVFGFDGSTITRITSNTTPTLDVDSTAWSPDGKYIVSGDSGSYVRVFSFDGSTLTYIDGDNTPAASVFSVAWSPDCKYIVSGDTGNNVRVFSFDGSTITYIDGDSTPASSIDSVAWSPDGKYIVSGDEGTYVRVFSFDGSTITYIDGDNTPGVRVWSVAWSPDGKYIVSSDQNDYVRVFSFDGSTLTYIDGDNTPASTVRSVAWSPDGKYIVSGDDSNYVRVYSFDGSTITHLAGTNPGTFIISIAWSPNGNYIAFSDVSGDLYILDAMFGPQSCLIDSCRICDTSAYGQFVGTGIADGRNSFINNVCYNNEVNYTYGVPNVFYGDHNVGSNTVAPFNNISMPAT